MQRREVAKKVKMVKKKEYKDSKKIEYKVNIKRFREEDSIPSLVFIYNVSIITQETKRCLVICVSNILL